MRLLLLIPIVIIVFFDYISKIYVKIILSENSYYILSDYIYLEKFYNKGIAFSLFDSDSIVLNYILLIIITIIILYLIYIFLRDLYSSSKVLLFSDYYFYNNKKVDTTKIIKDVVYNIPSIEKIILIPYEFNEKDYSKIIKNFRSIKRNFGNI